MMPETLTLTDFLLARIAEDERDAVAIRDCEWYHGVESDAEAEVQRLSDPARVLAECAAKRLVVEWAAMEPVDEQPLCFLALPYADHPDYDEGWRIRRQRRG